jgi:thiol-disulfide isomerase/thioredoxin
MLRVALRVLFISLTIALSGGCAALVDSQLEENAGSSTQCSNLPRDTYPSDNIGTVEGTTLESLSFTNTDGSEFSLDRDVFQAPEKKLLLLVTAAGWCTACREEQPALEALYQKFKADGLEVVVAVFEDNNFVAATTEFATSWRDSYSLNFPVVADTEFKLGAYYDPSLTPMAMLVDISKMEILNIQIGAQPATLETLVESQLGALSNNDCEEPTSNRDTYPSEGRGVEEGDTIDSLTFTNIDGTEFSLDTDVYQDSNTELLLLVTAAGWCTACREEQPALESLYQTYRSQGLKVVVAVFEDNNYNAATPDFASSWRDSYSLTFPVVADTEFKLGAYYDPSLTPMAMIVEVDTMTIVNIQIGAQPATLETLIQSQL